MINYKDYEKCSNSMRLKEPLDIVSKEFREAPSLEEFSNQKIPDILFEDLDSFEFEPNNPRIIHATKFKNLIVFYHKKWTALEKYYFGNIIQLILYLKLFDGTEVFNRWQFGTITKYNKRLCYLIFQALYHFYHHSENQDEFHENKYIQYLYWANIEFSNIKWQIGCQNARETSDSLLTTQEASSILKMANSGDSLKSIQLKITGDQSRTSNKAEAIKNLYNYIKDHPDMTPRDVLQLFLKNKI